MKKLIALCAVIVCIVFAAFACAGTGADAASIALKTPYATYTNGNILKKIQHYCDFYNLSENTVKQDLQIWEKLVDDTIYEYAFTDEAVDRAAEMGLLPLTQEEEQRAQTQYEQKIAEIEEVIAKKSGILPQEELRREVDRYLEKLGFTRESYQELASKNVMVQKVSRAIAEQSGITDEEVREAYDLEADRQKQLFESSPDFVTGYVKSPDIPLYYYPDGVRCVRTVTIPFSAGVRGQAAILIADGRFTECMQLLKEAEQGVMKEIQKVRNMIAQGATFDEIARKFDENGLESEVAYVNATNMYAEYVGALNQLKEAGDISECNTYQGHNFIYLDRVMPAGKVPFEQAKDTMRQQILEERTKLLGDEAFRGWHEESIADKRTAVDKDWLYNQNQGGAGQ